ncbi:SUN domain-containing protein 1 isoform X2 [Drosophila sechellia]|uniref:SUN domain-containing protein 1 isoform X2 n=1 Tax=Drosophila sechellia TaxID=7238 RepID=UPI0013DDA1EA|nr:SUN domain-containing protein 1 isoform X2 [Drosophila sechellia]
MDGCRRARKRVYVSYLLSFVLLACFFYYLMVHNSRNNLGIMRLREDVDDISHILRQQQIDSKVDQGSCKFNCLGGDPKGLGSSGRCSNRDKQVMSSGCSSKTAQSTPKHESAALAKPRINYASEDLGARIINVKAKSLDGTNIIRSVLGLDFSSNPPVNMIRAGLSPGSCFGFNGSRATVTLHLARTIIVEAITLTHVAREMTPDLCVKSAPKNFDVYGLRIDNSKRELMGQWSYDNAANKRTQSYSVRSDYYFRNLDFSFNSNHGANTTCIYRVEVYGRL